MSTISILWKKFSKFMSTDHEIQRLSAFHTTKTRHFWVFFFRVPKCLKTKWWISGGIVNNPCTDCKNYTKRTTGKIFKITARIFFTLTIILASQVPNNQLSKATPFGTPYPKAYPKPFFLKWPRRLLALKSCCHVDFRISPWWQDSFWFLDWKLLLSCFKMDPLPLWQK